MNPIHESGHGEIARDESRREDCFLCRPSAQLLAHIGEECFTMAGLGPLSDGYALIAEFRHGLSGPHEDPKAAGRLARYTESVQKILAVHYGSCVLAEHGKMPICHPNWPQGSHCFHRHFLLIPGAPDPLPELSNYFTANGERFTSLFEALSYAATFPNYLLGSSQPGEYTIFPAGEGLPRQFARGVVAESLGQPDLASWRTYPNAEWTARNAVVLRRLLSGQVPLENT